MNPRGSAINNFNNDAEDQAENDKSDLNDNLGRNSNPAFTSDQCCQS
jgi:hypothetical protein